MRWVLLKMKENAKWATMTIVLMAGTVLSVAQADLSPRLSKAIYDPARGETTVLVWIQMSRQLDFNTLDQYYEKEGFTIKERRNDVLRRLKVNHQQSLNAAKNILNKGKIHSSSWLGNSVAVTLTPGQVRQLAASKEVMHMELASERKALLEEYEKLSEEHPTGQEAVNGREIGLQVIGAPKMWKRGYTGQGRKALIVDTGVWPNHPSISTNWLGKRKPLKETWYGFDAALPKDKSGSHGTHVTGTVMGLDRSTNDTIGVAFNAQFIAADPVASESWEIKGLYSIVRAYEWALDPDGDTNTISDMPDVINNSWGHRIDSLENICVNPFGDVVAACQLAGMAVVWSAGNNGPNGNTIGAPATITRNPYLVFTVGAVSPHSANYPIASFSSRGPSHCILKGVDSIKPEVVAPGVSIRSAVDSTGYANYQGTSMAAPHVSGAVLLLKEAFPQVTGQKILEALYKTARDLGPVGEENAYGNGLIQVDSAYQFLRQTQTPVLAKDYSEDVSIEFVGFQKGALTCGGSNSVLYLLVNHSSRVLNPTDVTLTLHVNGHAPKGIALPQSIPAGDTLRLQAAIPAHPTGISGVEGRIKLGAGWKDNPANNTMYGEWQNLKTVTLPFTDDFKDRTQQWVIVNPNRDYTWNVKIWEKDHVQYEALQLEFFGMGTNNKEVDDLISPRLLTNDLKELEMTFSYANASKYVTLFKDELEVYATSRCNENWTRIWGKKGEELITAEEHRSLFVPVERHWRDVQIDLSDYDNESAFYVKFRGVNGYGNNLYIDNVSIHSRRAASLREVEHSAHFLVLPNPAKEHIRLVGDLFNYTKYSIQSIDGKVLLSGALEGKTDTTQAQLQLEGLSAGLYIIYLSGPDHYATQRFVIE